MDTILTGDTAMVDKGFQIHDLEQRKNVSKPGNVFF